TAVGAQWLPEVRRVLAEAADLPALAQRLARGETGSLTLTFVSTADYGILPGLLRQFGERHPDVSLQLREATSDLQIEALLDGESDAGLVIPPQRVSFPAALDYLPLARERLVLAVPEGWRPASRSGQARLRRGEVELTEAADAPLILFPRRSAPAFYDIITGCYAAHGLTPHVGQEAIQMQTIVSLVSAGMGVALVPESLRHLRRTGVRYLDLPAGAAPHVETGLIWRRQAMTPALQSFVEIARTMSS
ncbi:MAG TPA: LysR substrate-binding domain-containing protein, partial [Burkholderiaceae bacterium]|nr:LysR substrate-binding domain-containing protein [Burkholderiaceae bacterium]